MPLTDRELLKSIDDLIRRHADTISRIAEQGTIKVANRRSLRQMSEIDDANQDLINGYNALNRIPRQKEQP